VRRSWASVTVGALVLVVLAGTYLLIRSVSKTNVGSNGIKVYALFRDASGLYEKSRVQTAGISIGTIESRELDPASAKAKIFIRINPDITLYENAVVTKKSASLLGEYYLEIDPGTPFAQVNGQRQEMRKLKDGDRIMNVREPIALGDIINDVSSLIPILHDILQDVHKLTSGTITDIAENVNELIETNSEVLERLLNRVDHIAANVDSVTTAEADDVKQSLRNVKDITESIKQLVGATRGQVEGTGGKVQGSIDRLQNTLDNLDKTMKHVEVVTDRLQKGEGTAGRLLTDDTIARNVEDITEDAGTLVRSFSKLQTIVGIRSEYNFVSSTLKNYLSIQLLPRPDKFYLIELVEDPRGYRTQTVTFTNSSVTGPSSATTVTVTEQLRFTLMFGKRVGPIAGRFGIKESTGGAGVDLYLLDDRLSLSADVFDTRTNVYPRLKATVNWAVWKRNLFLSGGADDIINISRARAGLGGGRDWFIGAQLTFNDEDLKSLLLFGGGAAASAASK
jgi:phospholipid/cholesterol/gamma-HCH transport system substrate-binding protein